MYCVGKLQLRCVLQVMAYLHERGVKGFVTLNVLLFDEELQRAEETIHIIAAGGADAVIIQVSSTSVLRSEEIYGRNCLNKIFWVLQDIGVAMLVRQVAPSLPIHASTQMSITSADGADFARQLGAKRVVVGRELSIADISAVSAHTDAGGFRPRRAVRLLQVCTSYSLP